MEFLFSIFLCMLLIPLFLQLKDSFKEYILCRTFLITREFHTKYFKESLYLPDQYEMNKMKHWLKTDVQSWLKWIEKNKR